MSCCSVHRAVPLGGAHFLRDSGQLVTLWDARRERAGALFTETKDFCTLLQPGSEGKSACLSCAFRPLFLSLPFPSPPKGDSQKQKPGGEELAIFSFGHMGVGMQNLGEIT